MRLTDTFSQCGVRWSVQPRRARAGSDQDLAWKDQRCGRRTGQAFYHGGPSSLGGLLYERYA